MRAQFRIIEGDALTVLRTMPDASFDACLCDPPYGLSSTEKRNMRRMSPRATSRERASGFMGMAWDASVPGAEVWAELARVLKPGAPVLAFGGARTFHHLVIALEAGGLIVADTLCWLHSQGFPKGKAQLKPAWEPITLAFRPGPRALNLEDCRIPVSDDDYAKNCSGDRGHDGKREPGAVSFKMGGGSASATGRWPANVLLDEEAAEILDAQAGILTSGANPTQRKSDKFRNSFGEFQGQRECVAYRGVDRGGASRFFYCAKARGKDRGEGNEHPTVKPTGLTEWLARLLLAPDSSRLLVPYCGSGSEIVGAIRAGWPFALGIEREAAYVSIARQRLAGEAEEIDREPFVSDRTEKAAAPTLFDGLEVDA